LASAGIWSFVATVTGACSIVTATVTALAIATACMLYLVTITWLRITTTVSPFAVETVIASLVAITFLLSVTTEFAVIFSVSSPVLRTLVATIETWASTPQSVLSIKVRII
jgi:hypothetical protein